MSDFRFGVSPVNYPDPDLDPVTCSCCPYLYFGLAIMLVTHFVNFR